MRAVIRALLVCLGVWYAGNAAAGPPPAGRAHLQAARQASASGNDEQALIEVDLGLAVAPRDLELLGLKGPVLVNLRRYAAARDAYQAFVAAGATGSLLRSAKAQIKSLTEVLATFLDVALVNGPASIYLDSKSLGLFCTAAPSCKEVVQPGTRTVIAERSGFERWTGSVTVQARGTARLDITLVEKQSRVTVRVEPAGARVVLDAAPYAAPVTVPAGPHAVVASLEGYREARKEFTAQQGAPVDIEIVLEALPPPKPTPQVVVAPPPPPPPASSRTRKLTGIGVAAAGGVAVGVGLFFGAKARSTYDDAKTLCGSDLDCDSRADFDSGTAIVARARSQATTATWLVAGGGAAVIAGAVVWLTAPKERDGRTVRVVPEVNGQGAGLAVVGRF